MEKHTKANDESHLANMSKCVIIETRVTDSVKALEASGMSDLSVHIEFPDVSPDVANGLADSLAKDLRREVGASGKPIEPRVQRIEPTAQDLGTALEIVLGAPAAIILAKAVRDWARRVGRSDILINGILIHNVESADAAKIVEAIAKNKS